MAETEKDMLALISEGARRNHPEVTLFLNPLSEASLYRKALQADCRALKVMTLGPYEAPDNVWMPSVLY